MIEFAEDHYQWIPGRREFRLIEDEAVLVDVRPVRTDVQAQRIHDGWDLLTTMDTVENAQERLIDLWSRASGIPPDQEARDSNTRR